MCRERLSKVFLFAFLAFFLGQIFFWYNSNDIKPQFEIVANPPNKSLIKAMALGDKEFLFHSLALRLQNSGDIFAGFAPLKNYNYKNLYNWMILLDDLNYRSNIIPHLATYYYSNTQNKQDLIYIIDYLDKHADRNIDDKWLWLTHAILLANGKYNDSQKALILSDKLAKNTSDKDIPLWTKQLSAFIYADMGDSCMAFAIIKNLIDEHEQNKRQISAQEMEFMRHFIKNRLDKLKSEKFDPTKCRNYSKNYQKS